jgi:signal transduction histidine kinase
MDHWLENFARATFRRSGDTAHDLKTPLNVAVLNLELLRMRIRNLADGEEDEKVAGYARSIELELRRMARIFDTFFLLSTPPKGEDAPAMIDAAAMCAAVGSAAGYATPAAPPAMVAAHEPRIRQAFQLFFEGAARILEAEGRQLVIVRDAQHMRATISGVPTAEDFELTKIFKFYYTDPFGEADLSLAASRLIVETYGGELNAVQESDKVNLRLSLPLGEE